jgi:hypothetical protein
VLVVVTDLSSKSEKKIKKMISKRKFQKILFIQKAATKWTAQVQGSSKKIVFGQSGPKLNLDTLFPTTMDFR